MKIWHAKNVQIVQLFITILAVYKMNFLTIRLNHVYKKGLIVKLTTKIQDSV